MSTKSHLLKIREVQGVTGPNLCFASAKFVALKLLGLVVESRRLNDMIRSPWAKGRDRKALYTAWGKFSGAEDFNSTVLKAAVEDPSAGVRPEGNAGAFPIEFHSFQGQPLFADQLLRQQVPLVVGVGLHGTGSRDHFIVIVQNSDSAIWAVDSWDASTASAVVPLPQGMTFTKRLKVSMNAGTTTIPCATPWFGYYRDIDSKKALQLNVAL